METGDTPIASFVIRDVEPALKETLRVRAARNGRSMEAELREIVRDALKDDMPVEATGLATSIRQRFAPYGGVDLPEHPPVTPRKPPSFG